jgi:hypothetical protein
LSPEKKLKGRHWKDEISALTSVSLGSSGDLLLDLKEVKVRGGKAPYAGNVLKVMPIVPSPATFYDRERP